MSPVLFRRGTSAIHRSASYETILSSFVSIFGDTTSSSVSVNYIDDTRTLGKYYQSLGYTNDHASFAAALRGQSKDNWNSSLTSPAAIAYIKAGFTPI